MADLRVPDELRARYRTAEQIRSGGAIGNLSDGAEIAAHGLPHRLLAWPGTGFQTEAVHVVTVAPGVTGERYAYELAEEAMLCVGGTGEVWVRGEWATLAPGDIAYVPEGVDRQIRNVAAGDPFVLATQITPPQVDLYADHGLYNVELGVLNHDSIRKACTDARPTGFVPAPLVFNDTHADLRAWNLGRADIRSGGALFNAQMGAAFTGLGLPLRLVLWPGHGGRLAGFNYGHAADGVEDVIHKHPVSDEFLVLWAGRGQFFMQDRWVHVQAGDCVLAPRGVAHGHRSEGPAHFGGFASPPQLDLLLPTDLYDRGRYASPAPSLLTDED
jgi:mannose-6-phosphate isomerase-like protein (cupin superfamily)